METIVEINDLTRRFRRTTALDKVSLSIPRGGVFCLVGENGAGKTTLIKHVLGLMRAQSGTVRVFGEDPVKHPAKVLGRIGALSEDRDLPEWMTVQELMRYTRSFYPRWDPDYAEYLRDVFELDPKARLGTLSQGQLAKAGLLVAIAHRPEFLVLDEPSSGLDPNIRRNILESIVLTAGEEDRTVLFSSHLLDEVERVADHVAMIHLGNVVLDASMMDINETHHHMVIRSCNGRRQAPVLPGTLTCQGNDPEWTVLCDAPLLDVETAAAQMGCHLVESRSATLEEIFVARSGKSNKSVEV
jgi:ABC-2 type transport system ATP-binding protein